MSLGSTLAAWNGSSVPTFRDNLVLTLEDGIGCPETSGHTYRGRFPRCVTFQSGAINDFKVAFTKIPKTATPTFDTTIINFGGGKQWQTNRTTCPGCSVPEPYRSHDWALVPASPASKAEY